MATPVSITRLSSARYPATGPFHPSERYPEYPFGDALDPEPNEVYAGARKLFELQGYDRERFGSEDWNPLGHLIEPGMSVFIKPNWVLSRHVRDGNLWSAITHPSVLRAVTDYCWIALKGAGLITIGDAPQYDCNFEDLRTAAQLSSLEEMYQARSGPEFKILDLRPYWSKGKHFPSELIPLPGDPRGSFFVNVGADSALYDLANPDALYGAVYHRSETIASHTGTRQIYEFSRTLMESDVVVSVPKLKVHKKVGVTLNMKGLVGAATNKNLVVHYRLGPPSKGGDQYPDGLFTPAEHFLIKLERWMYDHLLARRNVGLEYLHRSIYWLHNNTTKRLGLKVAEEKRMLDAGNWHGNDSAWRMAVDLLRAFQFGTPNGDLNYETRRRTLSVVDGIVGGEGNGPLSPDEKAAGVLLAGESFLATDMVGARLMGFKISQIPMLSAAMASGLYGVRETRDVQIRTEIPEWSNCLENQTNPYLRFEPHPGWVGHLEVGGSD